MLLQRSFIVLLSIVNKSFLPFVEPAVHIFNLLLTRGVYLQLLCEIVSMGTDTQYVCSAKGSETVDPVTTAAAATPAQGNSDIESEDDDEVTEGWLTPLLVL